MASFGNTVTTFKKRISLRATECLMGQINYPFAVIGIGSRKKRGIQYSNKIPLKAEVYHRRIHHFIRRKQQWEMRTSLLFIPDQTYCHDYGAILLGLSLILYLCRRK